MNNRTSSFGEIIRNEPLVLVDFFAEWCGPCKIMAPILQEVKAGAGDQIRILKVDVDKSPSAGAAFRVQGVPTLILFKNGEPVWRQSGVVGTREILSLVRKHAS